MVSSSTTSVDRRLRGITGREGFALLKRYILIGHEALKEISDA